MSEILEGRTTRQIVFVQHDGSKQRLVVATRRMPAGTEVYARERSDGRGLNIRIPGTLFVQHVGGADVEPF